LSDVKTMENEQALTVLPGVLAELDAIVDPAERLLKLVQGAFAGNIFDLGAATSAELYADGGGTFHSTRETLKPRPWWGTCCRLNPGAVPVEPRLKALAFSS